MRNRSIGLQGRRRRRREAIIVDYEIQSVCSGARRTTGSAIATVKARDIFSLYRNKNILTSATPHARVMSTRPFARVERSTCARIHLERIALAFSLSRY